MSYNSSIADYVSCINVSLKHKKEFVFVPYTRVLLLVTKVLMDNGCIRSFFVIYNINKDEKKKKPLKLLIKIYLLYDRNSISIIKKIKLISKNSFRTYWSLNKLFYNFNKNAFSGFYIISTSAGIFTSTDLLLGFYNSKNFSLSGEILIKVSF